MSELESAKEALLAACEQSGDPGDAEQHSAKIKTLVNELVRHNPIAKPLIDGAFDGRWREAYSSLGVRYARGRPLKGEFDLSQLSFGKLPKVPVQLTAVHQEVDRATGAYNNVIDFDHAGTDAAGRVVMFGQFRVGDENPLRAHVDFSVVEVIPHGDDAVGEWREKTGIDGELRHDFKPPKLFSDVVYLDSDTRINFGNVGGVYVLRQTPDAPVSY